MAALVRFPVVGANIIEGTVGPWRRREGEEVRYGEPLVEIITSKATFDVESPEHGVLRKILAPEKSVLPVGYILAIVGDAQETLPDISSENAALVESFRAEAAASPQDGEEAVQAVPQKVRATPGARRLARELNIDLATIPPAKGSVRREDDVRRAAEERRSG